MKKEKSHKNKFGLILFIMVTLCIIAVCLTLFFTKGKTTTTGSTSERTEISKSVSCESDSIDYPLFEYDLSKNKLLQINAIFENDELASISLVYKLVYNNKELVQKSESVNHAAMNVSFGQNGMNADALSATYSKSNSALQMSIYANGESLNQKSLKYFMLSDEEPKQYTQEKLTEAYAAKGFNCNIKK